MTELLDVRTALLRVDEAIGRRVDGAQRAAFARASGLAAAGVRATVSLDAAGLGACLDLLGRAVERRLPLVVRVASVDGHESLHAAADRGCGVLVAIDLQEAVDLAMVARRAAERSLLPVVVAHDLDDDSVHDVELPGDALLRRCIGAADDEIGTPTPEQRMLFGDRRRRAPRWFDLERPALIGAKTEGRVRTAARASLGPFAASSAPALFDEAFAEVARATRRALTPLAEHRLDGARNLVVATGTAAAVAAAVVDHLRDTDKLAMGAIGIRCLRPFPAAKFAELLRRRRNLVLVERSDGALAVDPPFAREISALMWRAGENGRLGRRAHKNLSPWRIKDDPVLHVAMVGPGSRALCSADLLAFCSEVAGGNGRSAVHLGVDFAPARSAFPKRQALLDRVRRDHPGLGALGLRTPDRRDVRPQGAVTADVALEDLPAAAAILHGMLGGAVRSTVEGARGRLTVGPGVRTPGCEAPVDVVIAPCRGVLRLPQQLSRGAAVVLACGDGEAAALPESLTREHYVVVHRAPADWPDARLGSMVGALHTARTDLDPRKALAAFEKFCDGDAARIAAFRAAVDRTRPLENGELADCCCGDATPRSSRLLLPLARPGDDHDSLPRFWDQVGILHQTNDLDEIAPDPYLAAPTIPPLSSGFGRPGVCQATLPVFDPSLCTACGACWTACPDGAVGPLAFAPRALVEAGIDAAKRAGQPADALRMLVGKIAGKVKSAGGTAAAALQTAFDAVIAKSPPAEDRRASIDEAFAAVRDAVGALPFAGAADLPDGHLLALAIDPDSCKACGLCVAVCEPEALKDAPRTADTVTAASDVWKRWEAMPDTAGATVDALRESLGSAAALGLSRHGLLPLAPGDNAEPGSGPRLAVRLVLGALEAHGQPFVLQRLGEIGALQEKFAERIRETLAAGLPASDLDALAEGLDLLGRHDVALSDLAGRIGELRDSGHVDGRYLDRLVAVARQLADRRFALERGASGLGRARAGLAIAGSRTTDWACTFPANPFAMPAATGDGDAADLARGLCEGQVDAWLDDLRLLEHARLELERPAEAVHADARLRALSWADVTPEQRGGCPPLVLIAAAADLVGAELAGVRALLQSDLPVIVLALADGDDVPDLGLLALAERDAFVVQTSVGHPEHLVDGVVRVLHAGRPALVHVHAPSPRREGIAPRAVVERALEAVQQREFPLFTYDPGRPGVFGARLDLEGNPPDGTPASDRHAEVWRTLLELAGVETPFTERVKEIAEREVRDRHVAELDGIRKDADAKAAALRGEVEQDLADRLRGKLTTLALRGMS